MKTPYSICLAATALAFMLVRANAQQVPTPSFGRSPAFELGKGPVVALDEAHKNTHTFGSPPFRELVQLLQADGYRVRPLAEPVSSSSLTGIDVILLAGPGGWLSPNEALNDQEVAALLEWIRHGGSLLLLLDHMPAPRNSARLTGALGVSDWHNGYAMVQISDSVRVGPIVFWRPDFLPADAPTLVPTEPTGWKAYQGSDAVLARHPVTEGRNPNERVRHVTTFVGSAFQPPSGADVLLTLPRNATSFVPPETPNAPPVINSATPGAPVGAWVQGAVMKFGTGRVALFGDTALFSGGPAADNRIFVLNVMHWLSGLL